VAKQLQPSVVWIGDTEKIFSKAVSKADEEVSCSFFIPVQVISPIELQLTQMDKCISSLSTYQYDQICQSLLDNSLSH